MTMTSNAIYEERVSSNWTEALFASLTILFLMLLIWRISTGRQDFLNAALFLVFIFFLFYSLNYRTLNIRLAPESLKLKFGIFQWTIPLGNIGVCRRDDLPILMRYGGAGIHFMLIRGRYRASFNFLEHPRVVIALKRKAGLVRDISFSTRRPDEVIHLLKSAALGPSAA
ncbi:MAG: hypothetical protein GY719_17055 [bacterium]|nr:hypothetical protein [bacterium]